MCAANKLLVHMLSGHSGRLLWQITFRLFIAGANGGGFAFEVLYWYHYYVLLLEFGQSKLDSYGLPSAKAVYLNSPAAIEASLQDAGRQLNHCSWAVEACHLLRSFGPPCSVGRGALWVCSNVVAHSAVAGTASPGLSCSRHWLLASDWRRSSREVAMWQVWPVRRWTLSTRCASTWSRWSIILLLVSC